MRFRSSAPPCDQTVHPHPDETRRLRPTDLLGQAHLHLKAEGGIVLDLRPEAVTGQPAITTDLRCPGCAAEVRIDDVDTLARRAQLTCEACGHRFEHEFSGQRDRRPSPPPNEAY